MFVGMRVYMYENSVSDATHFRQYRYIVHMNTQLKVNKPSSVPLGRNVRFKNIFFLS